MSPVIHRYDDQAFVDISEESEKIKYFIVKKSWPVPTRGIDEHAEQNGELRPQRDNRGCALRPHPGRSSWLRMLMIKEIIK